jgi:sugar phosphate isomerase/epimerase
MRKVEMRPRLAAVSDDLSSEFSGAARVAAGLGLEGLAVRHVGGRNIADLDRTTVLGVRRTADQYGLDIVAASSPLGRGLALDADPGAAMVLLDTMLRYADVLQTNLVRFFACWIADKVAVQDWWDRPNLTAAMPRLVDRVGGFAARAERAGVMLMLELEGASYAGQVAEAHALMAAVDSPSLALCWDVANGWWSGEHPTAVGLELALGMPLVDVQVKDLRARPDDPTRPDLAQVALGSGDIDYPAIIAALRANNYAGWVTAERVYHPRRPELERTLQEAMVVDLRRLRSLLG